MYHKFLIWPAKWFFKESIWATTSSIGICGVLRPFFCFEFPMQANFSALEGQFWPKCLTLSPRGGSKMFVNSCSAIFRRETWGRLLRFFSIRHQKSSWNLLLVLFLTFRMNFMIIGHDLGLLWKQSFLSFLTYFDIPFKS